jgi:hypothetical protein
MRGAVLLILLAVLGAALAHAYILCTESLDVVYQRRTAP